MLFQGFGQTFEPSQGGDVFAAGSQLAVCLLTPACLPGYVVTTDTLAAVESDAECRFRLQVNGSADPTALLNVIAAAPWRGNAVLSPHLYPPSVSKFPLAQSAGPGLDARLNAAFGAYTLSPVPSL